jgi:hypothetical protein
VGLGAFGRQRPPEGRRSHWIQLRQGRAQRVEARGAGEPVLVDGTAEERRHRGVLIVAWAKGEARGDQRLPKNNPAESRIVHLDHSARGGSCLVNAAFNKVC